MDKKTQKGVFKPYVIKEIAGLKIGIFGLLDDTFNPTLQEKEPGLTILEPLSTSKALTKSLREYCDLIVVLSQLGESKDKKLAKRKSSDRPDSGRGRRIQKGSDGKGE